MDYQIGTIIFNQRKHFRKAIIVDGQMASICYFDEIPFREEEIVDIIVAHENRIGNNNRFVNKLTLVAPTLNIFNFTLLKKYNACSGIRKNI